MVLCRIKFCDYLSFGRFLEEIKTQQQYMASSDGDKNPTLPGHSFLVPRSRSDSQLLDFNYCKEKMKAPTENPLLLPITKSESRESLTYTHLKGLHRVFTFQTQHRQKPRFSILFLTVCKTPELFWF